MATLKLIADEIAGALDRPFDDMFKERIKSIFRHEAATIVRQAIDKDGVSDHFKTRYTASISIVDDTGIPCGSSCGVIRSGKLATPTRYKTDDPFTFVGNSDGTVVYIYTKTTELPYADLTEPYLGKPIRYIYQNGYIYIDGKVCSTITAIADYSATVAGTILITSASHELKTGYQVTISNTTNYNGDYTITVVDSDTYYITKAYVADEASGNWIRKLSDTECISIEGVYPINDVFANTPEARLNNEVFTDETELPIPEDLIQAIKLKLLQGELSIIDNNDKIQPQHIDN